MAGYFARTTIVPRVRVVVVEVMAKRRNMSWRTHYARDFERASFANVFLFPAHMAKPSDKKKVEVRQEGQGPALKHNPFGALSSVSAPEADAPAAPLPATENLSAPQPKSRGRLVLRREKKGRGGKTVVVVAGLRANAHLAESEIDKLAQYLKQQLGCGGAVERVPNDTEIVIQGDQPARIAELLRAKSFRVDGVTS